MNEWERNAEKSGLGLLSIGLVSALATGFIFSTYLWDALALDPARSSELWRLVSYTVVFEPSEYAYITFSALLIVSLFFIRHAEYTVGRGRVLLTMVLGSLFGGGLYTAFQLLVRGQGAIGGESMPAIASVLGMLSFVASRKVCFYFFLIPMNLRLAAFFTLLFLFLHTAAQTRSALSLLPLGAATVLGVALVRIFPWIDLLTQRSRNQAERRRVQEEEETRNRVDTILEKIHLQGMESLTREELRLLKRASRLLAENRVER